MQFTATEAEQILRERWDDADVVGGFANEAQRQNYVRDLREEHGSVIDAYELIGQTSFSDYEEGAQSTLWMRIEDGSLWTLDSGVTVYGDFGEDFLRDLEPADIQDWLETVRSNAEHAENFVGF